MNGKDIVYEIYIRVLGVGFRIFKLKLKIKNFKTVNGRHLRKKPMAAPAEKMNSEI